MATPAHTTHVWRFGVFEADAQEGLLRRAGVPIKLREQSFRILVLLLSHAGDLVAREDLRKALWPADTYVDFDHSLNAAVMKLREALGDTADKPLYIETVPKRGYRFIAPLANASAPQNEAVAEGAGGTRASEGDGPAASAQQKSARASVGFWTIFWVSFGTVVTLVGLSTFAEFLHHPLPPPRVTDYIQLTHDGRYKEVAAADSSRIYINLIEPDVVVQTPLRGGENVPITISLPGEEHPIPGLAYGDYPFVYDLSPDGSTFLCAGPSYSLWTVTITGTPMRRLATAESAAWSPDGKSVVYSWRGDLFLIQADATELRPLVPGKAFPGTAQFNSDLSWSPDGNRIRFTRNHGIWEVSLSDLNPHPLLAGWRPLSWKSHGHWTSDGAFFVFVSGEPNVNPIIAGDKLWALDERRVLFGSRNPQPIQLTSGPTHWSRAVSSRDGGQIFARGIVLHGELQRYDRMAQQWRPYLGGKSAEFVTFAPDRQSVAYVTFPEEVLYRSNLDGTAPQQLTEPPLAVKSANWSPDGSQILIDAQTGNANIQMYVVPAQGGPPKRLIPGDEEEETNSRWSPDGTKVVYTSSRFSGDLLGYIQPTELRIFDLTSKQITALPGSGNEFSTRWSPDGRYIAVLTIDEHKLKVFDLVSKRWTTLHEGITDFPAWSRDGSFIYFVYRDSAVARVPVTGGKVQFVASLEGLPSTGTFGSWFGLDSEDSPLLLCDRGTDEIYALVLDRK